jgi:hypothetical protein
VGALRFKTLNVPALCQISGCELTGDTVVFGQNKWGDAKNASIMLVISPSLSKTFLPTLACTV